MSTRTIFLTAFLGLFLIMLSTLGHGVWHRELTSILGAAVYLFTGSRTSG